MLKSSILVLGALLVGGAAQAGSFTCISTVEKFTFTLSGSMTEGKAAGDALMSVTKNGKPMRSGALPITASNFVPNQTFQLTANDPTAKFVVDARFQNGVYNGPLTINSNEGDINLTTSCKIQ